MIIQILVTCSIGSCQPIVGDAILRSRDVKEHSKLTDKKTLELYTKDGYGYTIKLNNNKGETK